MKTIYLFLLLFLSACSLLNEKEAAPIKTKEVSFSARKTDDQPRKRIVVMPFSDRREGASAELRAEARKNFIKALNKTDQVVLIDPKEIGIDATQPVETEENKVKELLKKASASGINAILYGEIVDLKLKRQSDQVGLIRKMNTELEVTAELKLLSTRNAQELFNQTKTMKAADATTRVAEAVTSDRQIEVTPEVITDLLKRAFISMVPELTASLVRIVWEGKVALVKGDRVFLNVGRLSGIQLGDILKVADEGDEIFDPDTGALIGKVPGKLKGTLEVVSYFGQDGAVAVVHSGAGFKENDRVELY